MSTILFSLKHTLKTPVFWILLAALLLLPPFLVGVGQESGLPKMYYVLEDPEDPDSREMGAFMDREGLLPLPDEETLLQGLRDGTYDSGVIVPANLTERLATDDLEGVVRLYFSPTAMIPAIKQQEVIGALFAVYSPHVTSKSLEGTGITPEEVRATYYERLGDPESFIFTFDLITEEGKEVPPPDTGRRFFFGALSLLLYLILYFAVVAPLYERFLSISERIGKKTAFLTIFLPGVLLRTGITIAVLYFATLLSNETGIFPQAALYTILLVPTHFLLMLLPGKNWKDIAILLFTAFALVLCPIYLDFALFWKPLSAIRFALPPYWLWALVGY